MNKWCSALPIDRGREGNLWSGKGTLRIMLNGRDVSEHCFYADELLGEVGHYLVNGKGENIMTPDPKPKLCTVFTKGIVRIFHFHAAT